MSFNELSQDQRGLVTNFMGAGSFAARNESLFNDTLRWFASGQSLDAEQGENFGVDENGPRSQFRGNIGRVINGETLAANDMFIMAYLANEVYGADIDLGRLNDESYLTHIQEQFEFITTRMDQGMGMSSIRGAFNEARLDAAERELAEFNAPATEYARETQALMNALGLREGPIDGEFTVEDASILRDNTIGWGDGSSLAARDFAFSKTLAGQDPTQAMAALEGRMFTRDGLNVTGGGAVEALQHLADGRDFTPIIEEAIASGDVDQIMMVQAIVGTEVTGTWNEETLDATQTYLEAPRGDGFPDTAYSAVAQTDPDLPAGMVSTNAVIAGLRDGSIPMPTDAQLDSMYAGLSEATLAEQHQSIAVWLNASPAHREEFGAMINANYDGPSSEITARIAEIRAEVELAATQAAAAEVLQNEAIINNPTLVEDGSHLAAEAYGANDMGDAIYTDTETAFAAMRDVLTLQAGDDGMIDLQEAIRTVHYAGTQEANWSHLGWGPSEVSNLATLGRTLAVHEGLPEEFDVNDPTQMEQLLVVTTAVNNWEAFRPSWVDTRDSVSAFEQSSPEWMDAIRSVAGTAPDAAPEAEPTTPDIDPAIIDADPALVSEVTDPADRLAEDSALGRELAAVGAEAGEGIDVSLQENCQTYLLGLFERCTTAPADVAEAATAPVRPTVGPAAAL